MCTASFHLCDNNNNNCCLFLVARASVSVTLPFLFIVNNNHLLASRESISECPVIRISINENAFSCEYQLTFIQCLSTSPSGHRLRKRRPGVVWQLAGVSAVSAAAAAAGGGGGGGWKTREHEPKVSSHCLCSRTRNSRGDVSRCALLLFIYVIIITIIVVCFWSREHQ